MATRWSPVATAWKVEGITLWLFGGVARLGGEAVTPQAELRIAAIGPLISFGVASAVGAAATARGALAGVRVCDAMTRQPHLTPDWLTIDAFLEEHALWHRFSAFPVVDIEGRLTGLVTLTRVKAVAPERRGETRVGDIARPLTEVPTAVPDEPLVGLLVRLSGDVDGRALVLADGTLVGIVSPTDVARTVEWATLLGPHPSAPGMERNRRDPGSTPSGA